MKTMNVCGITVNLSALLMAMEPEIKSQLDVPLNCSDVDHVEAYLLQHALSYAEEPIDWLAQFRVETEEGKV